MWWYDCEESKDKKEGKMKREKETHEVRKRKHKKQESKQASKQARKKERKIKWKNELKI